MAGKWLAHVKKTMKAHKGKSFKVILKEAKKTYKGGNEPTEDKSAMSPAPVGGRRHRRGSRKTRRGSRRH